MYLIHSLLRILLKDQKGNILSIMMEDRGPQITFEFVNSYDLTPELLKSYNLNYLLNSNVFDLRIPVA